MTSSHSETVEVPADALEGRAPWAPPRVDKMRAGDAEDGIDPNVSDGLITYS